MCSIMSEAYHSIKRIVRAGWCQGEGGGGGIRKTQAELAFLMEKIAFSKLSKLPKSVYDQ